MSFLNTIWNSASYLQSQLGETTKDGNEETTSTEVNENAAENEQEGQPKTTEDDADIKVDEGQAYHPSLENFDEQLNKGVDAAYDYGKKLGGFLYTFASAASQQMKTHADKLVEGTVLQDFNEERDKFEKEQKEGSRRSESEVLPWIGFSDEEDIRKQVLSLSADERNFLRDPPQGIQFQFDLNHHYPSAVALLEVDKNLQNMRYNLVPKKLKEDAFWRNYFYRVTLITQSAHLKSTMDSGNGNRNSNEEHSSSTVTQRQEKERVLSNGSNDGVQVGVDGGVNQEDFVSDTFDADQEQMERMRREIESLEQSGEKKSNEQDSTGAKSSSGADGVGEEDDGLDEIERELEDLDAEFEVVNEGGSGGRDSGNNDDDSSSANTAGWENELEQMLENEVQQQ